MFPNIYFGKFVLKNIKEVGLFRDYETIDECLFGIFKGLDYKPIIIEKEEKDKINLIIIVPLITRRYPEINFPLKHIEKNDSQKIEELIDALLIIKNNKDKEIKELKDKIENLEKIIKKY